MSRDSDQSVDCRHAVCRFPNRPEAMFCAQCGRKVELPQKLDITAAVLPVPKYYPLLAREVFRAFRSLGVRVHTKTESPGDFLNALETGEVDVVVGRWFASYPDADSFYHQLYDSRSGHLREYFRSKELDHLIDMSRAETDPILRQSLFLEIESILSRRAVMLPFVHEKDTRFVQPRIQGLQTTFGFPSIQYEALHSTEAMMKA